MERLQAAVGRLGLTLLASENLAITGSTVARFRVTNGRSPAELIGALAAIQLVAVAQPNYLYSLQQQGDGPAPASRGDSGLQGDAAQYVLEKLKISDVHRIAKGANVPIAVIDSEIDAAHPDLEGAVTQRFDAVGAPEKPHPHGTGMAGAIAAHRRLLGIAPGARLLAVHTFSSDAAKAESTTFNILKGIDWSVRQGARIINMSFAGPRDPSLDRALKAAYDKGVVLIAAAGNAGPKSPPLFPGADPYVIAVTATDVDDKLFAGANRGKYISVAAPGVDILVPAPEGEYQMTTGTSVAAAEVSGIVALLLERNPKLDAGRHSPHPDREREAARAGRARRQFRLRPDRSLAGAAVGRSENRNHHATAAAVERASCSRRRELVTLLGGACGRTGRERCAHSSAPPRRRSTGRSLIDLVA